jgi:signal transduction histidine kinase
VLTLAVAATQLQARLAELQASRLRIVAAQHDQRRRTERDIHDGAQQQLLSITSKLALAGSGTEVMFTVADGGPGFDPAAVSAGSGLQNLSDRLAALGGSCQVDSSPGRGPTVAGRIGFPAAPAENAGAMPLTSHMA